MYSQYEKNLVFHLEIEGGVVFFFFLGFVVWFGFGLLVFKSLYSHSILLADFYSDDICSYIFLPYERYCDLFTQGNLCLPLAPLPPPNIRHVAELL